MIARAVCRSLVYATAAMVGSALGVLGLDAASVIRPVTDLQIRVEMQALWASEPDCLSPITFAKRHAVVRVGQHQGP